jgi:predicted transcriptional regulator
VLNYHADACILILEAHSMRRQFVLDKDSNKQLEELAETRAGNRSLVVREAIGLYAAMEASLEEVEANPNFVKMMERTSADIRDGRVHTQDDVERRVRGDKRRR